MSEPDIKKQLKKLVELQKLDAEIYDLKREVQVKPELVEELKEQFEQKKIRLKELEEKATVIQLGRKEQERELQAREEEIKKANGQLSQLKTNKEYTAKISEIENIKADKSVCEEKILVSLDESDSVNGEIQEEKKKVEAQEKIFLEKKKEVEESIKVMEDRIKVLQSQRQQLLPEIDKDLLNKYEKVLENRKGLALVPLHGNACGGCFMNVTSQTVNEIKMHKQIISCEMCSRILYIEDDL